MTGLEPVTKRCNKCGETKPGSEFNRGSGRHGLQTFCRECSRISIDKRTVQRRVELGEEAFLERQRQAVQRYRANPANRERGNLSTQAYNSALFRLSEMHPAAFTALLRIERSKRGLDPEATRGKRNAARKNIVGDEAVS